MNRKNQITAVRFLSSSFVSGVFVLIFLLFGVAACRTSSVEKTSPSKTKSGEKKQIPKKVPKEPTKLFAKRFVTHVYSKMDRKSEKLGYLRGGSVHQATTPEPMGVEGCAKGWFELKSGGFVCGGAVIPFEEDHSPEFHLIQPSLEAKLPYPYGFIRKNETPMFKRLPSKDEIEGMEKAEAAIVKKQLAEKDGAEKNDQPTLPTHPDVKTEKEAPAKALNNNDVKVGSVKIDGQAQSESESVQEDEPPLPTLDSLQGDPGSVVLRKMMRGFYLSLDKEFESNGRKYWRTQSSGYVPSKNIYLSKGSDFRGVVLKEGEWQLPVGFIVSKRAKVYAFDEQQTWKRVKKKPDYHAKFQIEEEIKRGRKKYWVSKDQQYFDPRFVRVCDKSERPKEVGVEDFWIDVDLSSQTLVAYVGDTPVYATLISSGRVKDRDDPEQNHETPVGLFQINAKHLTHTMDGDNAIDGPYSIDDVPYVQYFKLDFALHAAFWHNRFGKPKSHGCVNLAPFDARWLFRWSTPPLPSGWHGAYTASLGQKTFVRVRGETPEG